MRMTDIITTTEADKGFYPTPPDVANELLSGINWRFVSDILEPSAGKGDLVNTIAEKCAIHALRGYNSDCKISIDCVEIDPYLRSILRYEFGGEREKEIRERLRGLESKRAYDPTTRTCKKLTPEEAEEERSLKLERDKYRTVNVHIVHDDFMTFNTQKGYDLIVMNPPFTDGDAHLLKALELASSYGGEVRCLLNAETILNPYTNRRKLLARKLDELGAEVSFIHNAFKNAERNTDVSVAVIKAKVPAKQYESTIYERLKKAANVDEIENEVTDIAIENYLENIVARFNLEMKSGIALIDEYNGLRPYILEEVSGSYDYPNLTLCVGDPGRLSRAELPSRNKFVKLTRKKYWQALLSNPDFMAKMTTNIREKYVEKRSTGNQK